MRGTHISARVAGQGTRGAPLTTLMPESRSCWGVAVIFCFGRLSSAKSDLQPVRVAHDDLGAEGDRKIIEAAETPDDGGRESPLRST